MTALRKLYLSFVFLGVILFCKAPLFAADSVSVEDRIIGATFKGLARAFVAVADINKLKKDGIVKLEKMSEEKFKKRYALVYEVIKDLPDRLKSSYGVTEMMSRGQAIKNIKSLDKKRIYKLIDSVPDEFIANQFKQYLRDRKQASAKINLAEEINEFWHKMIKNMNIKGRGHP